MSKVKPDKPLRFEEAIVELERLIEQVESGQAGLEESLASYERGIGLIAHCRSILDAAEKKIAELSVTSKGKLKEEPAAEAE